VKGNRIDRKIFVRAKEHVEIVLVDEDVPDLHLTSQVKEVLSFAG